jgi:hypothetical protein
MEKCPTCGRFSVETSWKGTYCLWRDCDFRLGPNKGLNVMEELISSLDSYIEKMRNMIVPAGLMAVHFEHIARLESMKRLFKSNQIAEEVEP